MFKSFGLFLTNNHQNITTSGFHLFGMQHLLFLSFLLIGVLLACRYYQKIDERHQIKFRMIIAWMIVLLEIIKDINLIVQGTFSLGDLPFHLCGLNIFFILYHAYRPTDFVSEWLFAVCMPSTLLALFFPDWTAIPILSYQSIHNFLIHMMLLLYPALLLAGGFVPSRKRLVKCLLLFIGIMFVLSIMNYFFKTNFLFLSEPAPGTPLVWFASKIGQGYVFLMPVALIIVWFFEYFIYDMMRFIPHQEVKKKRI